MRVPLYILVCGWEIHGTGGFPIAMLPEGRIQPKMLKPEDVERLMDSTHQDGSSDVAQECYTPKKRCRRVGILDIYGGNSSFLCHPGSIDFGIYSQTADGVPGFGLELDVLDMPAHFMERWAYDARTGLLEDWKMSG